MAKFLLEQTSVFNFPGYIPKGGTSGSSGNPTVSLLEEQESALNLPLVTEPVNVQVELVFLI